MHFLMAAMLWNLAPATRLAQIAVLTGAALWFITQAVTRPDIKIFCANGQGPLKCVYHSLAMAGAALMIVMMSHGTSAGHDIVPSGGMAGMPGTHDHLAMATAAPVTAATVTAVGPSPNLALLLTVFFAAAAVTFIILLLRFLATKTTLPHAAASQLSVRAEHSIEALGAAAMALMFATMTA